MADNIFAFQRGKATPKIKPEDMEDRHVAMMHAIAPFAKPVPKNLTQVEIHQATKNTNVALILMPEWNEYFPPFNISRLSGIAKRAGYPTTCYDINIESHFYYKTRRNIKLDFNPWDPARFFQWTQNYRSVLHPIFEPFFEKKVKQIVEQKPDVIGFTAYYCNIEPIKWMARRLKMELPDTKFVIGGSYLQSGYKDALKSKLWDYIVVGEGEILLLEVLAEVENGIVNNETKVLTQPDRQRINLNNLPSPDYSDLDFTLYRFPNGILTEFSRGCVAKCTFCDETHFWNFRQRQSTDAITEIEKLYYEKGTDVVWFIDSLVNGNLNELRAFCKAVVSKGLDIHWTGYARCNGKMDLEYYQDLAAAGCTVLNYGCETASDYVLESMDKRVTLAEMEQNFIDGHKAGVAAMTNWIIGFPTERPIDFQDTLTFIYRTKELSVVNYANSTGFNIGPNSIIGQNPERFDLANMQYVGHWIKKDLDWGKPHLLTRSKIYSTFLKSINLHKDIAFVNRTKLPGLHYNFDFVNEDMYNQIDYEKFDYNIVETGLGPWADNLINEILVLFRMLYRIRGPYKGSIKFEKQMDIDEFGPEYAGELDALYEFEINEYGKWKFKYETEFSHPDPSDTYRPFTFFDLTTFENAAAMRARKLAKSKYGMSQMSEEDRAYWNDRAQELSYTLDLRFKTDGEISGSGW